MKIFLILAGLITLATVSTVIVGYFLPIRHQAVREANFTTSPVHLWQLISNFADAPTWRADIKSVESLKQGDELLWKEVDSHGHEISYRTVEFVPEIKMVRQIADKSLPFGGSWTFEITPTQSGCKLRIVEDGEVYNPVFRFLSRFVFGHATTIERYLAAAGRKLENS